MVFSQPQFTSSNYDIVIACSTARNSLSSLHATSHDPQSNRKAELCIASGKTMKKFKRVAQNDAK